MQEKIRSFINFIRSHLRGVVTGSLTSCSLRNCIPTRRFSARVPEFTCQVAGCCQVFDALEDYEHHYHTLHGNVCSYCKRAFPSAHLLDTHILEWHDSLFQILAERQDMYQCRVEGCTEKFRTSRDRKEHLVAHHLYPADFRFDKPRKGRGYVVVVEEAAS